MKAVVLYRPDSEFARPAEEFAHDFARQTTFTAELVNIDGAEGSAQAKLYDVMDHPAVLVIRDDGALVKSWVGSSLPRIQEVAGYLAE